MNWFKKEFLLCSVISRRSRGTCHSTDLVLTLPDRVHNIFENKLLLKMDLFIKNSGLYLIGIKIFSNLSIEDKFNCCMVSKSWQTFIFENVFETCLQFQALQNVLKCHCLRCKKKTGLEDKIIANVEELLLKSVIKGWYQLFRFLLPKRRGLTLMHLYLASSRSRTNEDHFFITLSVPSISVGEY